MTPAAQPGIDPMFDSISADTPPLIRSIMEAISVGKHEFGVLGGATAGGVPATGVPAAGVIAGGGDHKAPAGGGEDAVAEPEAEPEATGALHSAPCHPAVHTQVPFVAHAPCPEHSSAGAAPVPGAAKEVPGPRARQ